MGTSTRSIVSWMFAALLSLGAVPAARAQSPQWLTFEGGDGPGKGKNIVLVSGDDEYRSEEALPELAAILATHHGFHCTVLFAIDPRSGNVDPSYVSNIPGLEALDQADLMIILTRFRALPDDQMKHIEDYLKSGKPVIGLRTATHAFTGIKGEYERYNNDYHGPEGAWRDGFGRLVLGEHWISHHGGHKSESTRGRFAPEAKTTELVNGIEDGDIWVPTDVYGVRLPLPGDCRPIILGEVTQRAGGAPNGDVFFGMRPTDKAVEGEKKNNPMMPVAWIKTYQIPEGKQGGAFATTMGSATDLTNEAFRRLVVNAVYVLLDMKVPAKADVSIIGDYKPSAFGFNGYKKGLKPADFQPK